MEASRGPSVSVCEVGTYSPKYMSLGAYRAGVGKQESRHPSLSDCPSIPQNGGLWQNFS
jgi:hypothetical protein